MHIFKTSGLHILARRDAPTCEEWLELLRDREQHIANDLHSMSLKTLGELKFVSDYFGDYGLNSYRDTLQLTGDARFGLETRGIFPKELLANKVRTYIEPRQISAGHDYRNYSQTERF